MCAASSGPDPQLEQISSAPWRAGDDARLPQLWDIGGLWFFFSAGKDFCKCFLIYDAKAVFVLFFLFFFLFFFQDFVLTFSSANSALAVISASKI